MTSWTAVAAAGSVPVDPDRPTATRWLTEELSRPEYAEDESLLWRLLGWLVGLFDGLDGGSVAGPVLATAAVVLVAVLVLVAWRVAGPVRLRRAHRTGSVVVHEDDPRTAAEMRAAADAAAAREDWPVAVLERFRAVVRELEERVVIDELPGRTAVEAGGAAATRLPGLADDLRAAARLFDGVCYGHLPAGPRDDDTLRRLDDQVRSARPAPTSVPEVVA